MLVLCFLISPTPQQMTSSTFGGVWTTDALQVLRSFLAREGGMFYTLQ